MKIVLRFFFITIILQSFQVEAQYCNTAASNLNIVPTLVAQNTPIYNSGRRAFNFTATAGCVYEFATCGLTGVDTYLRLYSTATGGALLAQNDDFCGAQSTIVWSCPTTGNYSILLTRYTFISGGCANLNANASMSYRVVSCTPPPANDNCANAESISIQCPTAPTSISGTTLASSEEGSIIDPNCDPGTIRDVWYTFNSGSNTTVNLSVTLGTASWLGGQLFTSCGVEATGLTIGGNPGNCDFNLMAPAPTVISGLTANTVYLLRLFTNIDFDVAGSFSFTLTGLNVNNPGAISVPASICEGNATSITNVSAATGTPSSVVYYFYYRGGPSNVGWTMYDGPTTNTSSALPAAVINTPGNWFVARNSDFGCGQANNVTTLDIPLVVNSNSTAPTITPIAGTVCPNTNTTLSAGGGIAGTGSTINWYSGPNGTGTFLGSGGSIVVAPAANTTYYARREGTCNTTADASVTVNVKNFVYALNGTTSNTYCTDNAGWNHFYSGDEIIFSVQGDLSGAPVGYPLATINDNGTFHQETEGPGTAPGCTSNQNPNEERFEMERSWNLDMGGGAPIGTYNIRFYYQPAERTAIETAAVNWMATYPACGYGYKYPNPLGFYWFKNSGSNYTAPDYDGTQYAATVASVSGVNYAEWTGIPSFSGGSGAIILEPITTLPVELNSFAAICNESGEEVTVRWSTASEQNSSHFAVDRSFDGTDWEVIGTVHAAGNSTSYLNYELTDSDVRGHAVVYYRLNQFDYDGASKTYGPTSAECLNDQLGFEVFPNPAGTDLTVKLHGEHQIGGTEIIFTDLNGKEVKRIIYTEQTGKMMSVDLRNLEPGVYLVRLITSDTNNQFVRLIKQ